MSTYLEIQDQVRSITLINNDELSPYVVQLQGNNGHVYANLTIWGGNTQVQVDSPSMSERRRHIGLALLIRSYQNLAYFRLITAPQNPSHLMVFIVTRYLKYEDTPNMVIYPKGMVTAVPTLRHFASAQVMNLDLPYWELRKWFPPNLCVELYTRKVIRRNQ